MTRKWEGRAPSGTATGGQRPKQHDHTLVTQSHADYTRVHRANVEMYHDEEGDGDDDDAVVPRQSATPGRVEIGDSVFV